MSDSEATISDNDAGLTDDEYKRKVIMRVFGIDRDQEPEVIDGPSYKRNAPRSKLTSYRTLASETKDESCQ